MLRSRRGNELIGVVTLAAGLTVGLALATYNPSDPSAFASTSQNDITNAVGYYGATIAWVLISFLGLASFVFPIALLLMGWKRFWGQETEHFRTKLLGFVILVISIPPLLDLTIGSFWMRGALLDAGGYLGREIRNTFASNLNAIGAAIALVTVLIIGLLLTTRISLADIFRKMRELILAFSRQVVITWSRITERRRKDRMKSEVVRKHIEQSRPALVRVNDPDDDTPAVREVRGRGSFHIRKVTRDDLMRAVTAAGKDPEEFREMEAPPDPEPYLDELAGALPAASVPGKKGEGVVLGDESNFRERAVDERKKKKVRHHSKERLPYVNLLEPGSGTGKINDTEHRRYLEMGQLIEQRCSEFNVDGEVVAYHPGPVVTTFEFKPAAGVKYAKVVNLQDDLALALEAESIRIERISGSSTVGIEIPNDERELIALRDIIDTSAFKTSESPLTMAVGKDIHGEPVVTDLTKMPHLLVAGATGAGKSVGLNSMITSLLYKSFPRDMRLLMIDPKMVELKVYEDVPHLLHPIVTDPKLAANALLWTVQEMENRYKLLASLGVRNIVQFNELITKPDKLEKKRARLSDEVIDSLEHMHYIVVIIDEFADLMMVASKEVEEAVTRLAQKARAVGIHLIIATQRPSVDVITGVIKANFSSRISFQVASKVDSRTILDTQGAEKLLGDGDMLFLPPGTARMRRMHGAYVSESEIAAVVEFVRGCQGEPEFLEEITATPDEPSAADGIEHLDDPKYDDAVKVILKTGQASASYLQRRLRLGYSRAARLIEMMEANGIVGPSQGSKPREILIREDDYPGMDQSVG